MRFLVDNDLSQRHGDPLVEAGHGAVQLLLLGRAASTDAAVLT